MNVIYQPEGARIDTPQNREYLSSPAALERAMHDGAVVEGMVTLCDNHMRLHVNLGCAVGIIEPDEALFCRDGEDCQADRECTAPMLSQRTRAHRL